MSDEFDVIHLGEEEVQDIIDWAVSAAAMVILMKNAPEHQSVEEGMERLAGYIQAHGLMWENLPEIMVHPATVVAQESYDDAVAEEEQVEQFRDELRDL